MGYWFLFIIVVLTFTLLYSLTPVKKEKNICLSLLAIFLVYFSAFRDRLGQDYLNYLAKMEVESSQDLNIFREPLFNLLAKIVGNTELSPVFLFLFFAIITVSGVLSYYHNMNNRYVICSIIIYCLIPILYFNSFNLVRQCCAASIFFWSLKYVENGSFKKYSIAILIASTIHLSSILLLPLYFILKKKFSVLGIVTGMICSYLLLPLLQAFIPVVSVFDRYMEYFDSRESMGSSSMIMLYNILGVYMLIFRRKMIKSETDTIAFNLFFCLLIFSNLSYRIFYFYRFSVFFMPVIAYMFPKIIDSIIRNRVVTYYISLAFSLSLFGILILGNLNNSKILPQTILPLISLFDNYYPY